MKYKKHLAKLAARQKAWESMGANDQKATTKPGSKKK